jgi:hypothetical protein
MYFGGIDTIRSHGSLRAHFFGDFTGVHAAVSSISIAQSAHCSATLGTLPETEADIFLFVLQ